MSAGLNQIKILIATQTPEDQLCCAVANVKTIIDELNAKNNQPPYWLG